MIYRVAGGGIGSTRFTTIWPVAVGSLAAFTTTPIKHNAKAAMSRVFTNRNIAKVVKRTK